MLVLIHGESYEWNSGNPYDGSVLAAYGSVVVVTLNYRLGVLGFFSSEETGPANFGILDQMAALRWVHENIGFFGGDRHKVTLMGEGTGASMIYAIITSPIAQLNTGNP